MICVCVCVCICVRARVCLCLCMCVSINTSGVKYLVTRPKLLAQLVVVVVVVD